MAGITVLPIRLPDSIEAGALCIPSSWDSHVDEALDGRPYANANRSDPVGEWDLSAGRQYLYWGNIKRIMALHMVTRGQSKGFLFRDPADYRADTGEGFVVNVGGTLYLSKRYIPDAAQPSYYHERVCKRPISGTVTISGGGSVNYTTGVVTGTTAGTACTFHFLKAVRFTNDRLPMPAHSIQGDDSDQIEVSSILLREIIED
jgi:uncharacterized protein (TIGR02217 family)